MYWALLKLECNTINKREQGTTAIKIINRRQPYQAGLLMRACSLELVWIVSHIWNSQVTTHYSVTCLIQVDAFALTAGGGALASTYMRQVTQCSMCETHFKTSFSQPKHVCILGRCRAPSLPCPVFFVSSFLPHPDGLAKCLFSSVFTHPSCFSPSCPGCRSFPWSSDLLSISTMFFGDPLPMHTPSPRKPSAKSDKATVPAVLHFLLSLRIFRHNVIWKRSKTYINSVKTCINSIKTCINSIKTLKRTWRFWKFHASLPDPPWGASFPGSLPPLFPKGPARTQTQTQDIFMLGVTSQPPRGRPRAFEGNKPWWATRPMWMQFNVMPRTSFDEPDFPICTIV